jgi:hypothetical protein
MSIKVLMMMMKQFFPDDFNKPTLYNSLRTGMHSLFVPETRKRITLHSMFYSGVRAYNDLPLDIGAAQTKRQFNVKLNLLSTERLQSMGSTAALHGAVYLVGLEGGQIRIV